MVAVDVGSRVDLQLDTGIELDGEVGTEVELVVNDVHLEVVELVALEHTLIAVVIERGVILHLG